MSAILGKHSSYFYSKVLCGFTKPTRSLERHLNHCLCKLVFSAGTENSFQHKINEGKGRKRVEIKYFYPLKCNILFLHSVELFLCFPVHLGRPRHPGKGTHLQWLSQESGEGQLERLPQNFSKKSAKKCGGGHAVAKE